MQHFKRRIIKQNEKKFFHLVNIYSIKTFPFFSFFFSDIPAVDLSKFYRDELVHAIADIRKDFEILSQTRLQQYEEYYRIKTEELHQRIAKESERKSLLNIDDEETDMNSVFSLLTDTNEEYKQLKLENNQLDIDLNDTLDDLKRIREEQIRENEKLDLEFNQLQQEFENKQDIVNKATENNISLQFELSTYRNLLNSEEKRINRNQQEQHLQTSTSPKPKEIMKGFSVKKIAVKKTTTGFEAHISKLSSFYYS
jgi:chromosome segregation ATPase